MKDNIEYIILFFFFSIGIIVGYILNVIFPLSFKEFDFFNFILSFLIIVSSYIFYKHSIEYQNKQKIKLSIENKIDVLINQLNLLKNEIKINNLIVSEYNYSSKLFRQSINSFEYDIYKIDNIRISKIDGLYKVFQSVLENVDVNDSHIKDGKFIFTDKHIELNSNNINKILLRIDDFKNFTNIQV